MILTPCDTIRLTKVEWAGANITVLRAALEADGYETVLNSSANHLLSFRKKGRSGGWNNYNKTTGTMELQRGEDGNAIRRSYSNEIIRQSAKRFGWNVTKKGERKFAVQKRF